MTAEPRRWEYKLVLAAADGTCSVDHARLRRPAAQVVQELVAQGWQLVRESELPGPDGPNGTYLLRRAPDSASSSSPSSPASG